MKRDLPLTVNKNCLGELVHVTGRLDSEKSRTNVSLNELFRLVSQGDCVVHLFDLKGENSAELFAAMKLREPHDEA